MRCLRTFVQFHVNLTHLFNGVLLLLIALVVAYISITAGLLKDKQTLCFLLAHETMNFSCF